MRMAGHWLYYVREQERRMGGQEQMVLQEALRPPLPRMSDTTRQWQPGGGQWDLRDLLPPPSAGQELEIPRSELSGLTRAGVLLAKGEACPHLQLKLQTGQGPRRGPKLRRLFPSMENFP